MDISGQIRKRSELDKLSHEINSLNIRIEARPGAVTNRANKVILSRLIKRKEELEKELDEA